MKIVFLKNFKGLVSEQKSLVDLFFLLIYKLTLDFVYSMTISPLYRYAGMKMDFSLTRYLIGTVVFLVLLEPVRRLYRDMKLSSLTLLMLSFLYFIPGLTFYSFGSVKDLYFIYFLAYWMLLLLFNSYLTLPVFKKFDLQSNRLLFYIMILVLIAGVFAMTGIFNGFDLHFSITDVYSLRFAQRDMQLPTIVIYFQSIAATLVPIGIVYCFITKKYWWAWALVAAQLLSFAFGGMKMTLFLLFVALLASFFYNERRVRWLGPGFVAINAFALIENIFTGFSTVSKYVIYRVFFIPNLLSYQYYDYFGKHELLLWRESILSRFGFSSPYDLPSTNLIARIYYADVKGCANNGLCGDAFANFGWFGLIIFPLLIVVYNKFLDSCSKGVDSRILVTAAVVFAIGYENASFFVLLLSNGFLFASIFLFAIPLKKN